MHHFDYFALHILFIKTDDIIPYFLQNKRGFRVPTLQRERAEHCGGAAAW